MKSELIERLEAVEAAIALVLDDLHEAAHGLRELVEPHECWFEPVLLADANYVHLRCECGATGDAIIASMYNAMRHLDAELLDRAAIYIDHDKVAAVYVESLDTERLRTAAEAMRRNG